MRNSIAAHLALSAVMLLGSEGPASAGAVVDLEWISTSNTSAAANAGIGTDTLQAAPGDIVGLRMILSAGTEGISSWGISIRFDEDGSDELDISGVPEEFGLNPTVTCTPFPSCFFLTPGRWHQTPGIEGIEESGSGSTGFAFSFEAQDTAGTRWFKGNTHTHTLWSDGDAAPEWVVAWYKEHDYDFLSLTDHNIVLHSKKVYAIAPDSKLTPERVDLLTSRLHL